MPLLLLFFLLFLTLTTVGGCRCRRHCWRRYCRPGYPIKRYCGRSTSLPSESGNMCNSLEKSSGERSNGRGGNHFGGQQQQLARITSRSRHAGEWGKIEVEAGEIDEVMRRVRHRLQIEGITSKFGTMGKTRLSAHGNLEGSFTLVMDPLLSHFLEARAHLLPIFFIIYLPYSFYFYPPSLLHQHLPSSLNQFIMSNWYVFNIYIYIC